LFPPEDSLALIWSLLIPIQLSLFLLLAGCPYFAAQHMAEAAQLIFCPYNYLISPVVRRAMDIDISGSIIILDEAQ